MYTLDVEKRDLTIKAKKLRKIGFIPGSLAGRTPEETLLVQIPAGKAKKFLKENSRGALVTLSCDGVSYPAVLKSISRAPIDGQPLDLAFQSLFEDVPVNSAAQVVLRNADKITVPVNKLVNEIPYTALPKDLVELAEIDLAQLRAGDRVKVADLALSGLPGLEVLLAPDTLVITLEGR